MATATTVEPKAITKTQAKAMIIKACKETVRLSKEQKDNGEEGYCIEGQVDYLASIFGADNRSFIRSEIERLTTTKARIVIEFETEADFYDVEANYDAQELVENIIAGIDYSLTVSVSKETIERVL